MLPKGTPSRHMKDLFDVEVRTIDGQDQTLAPYRGRVLLVVNTASQCGFTPQFAGLEDLYRRYRDRGLTVLGFPCDQFGHQEPGNEAEIKSFCATRYDVSFPLFAKVQVNGAAAHPLFDYLKSAKRGLLGTRAIKWNFTKFLVNRQGRVVGRFGPTTTPRRIESKLLPLLS
jgi:glutathione peroxidase